MFFQKNTPIEDVEYPIRKYTEKTPMVNDSGVPYTNVYCIYVGQKIASGRNEPYMEIIEIIYRKDYFDEAQEMFYDVYSKKLYSNGEEGAVVRWKRLPHNQNVTIEYEMDF